MVSLFLFALCFVLPAFGSDQSDSSDSDWKVSFSSGGGELKMETPEGETRLKWATIEEWDGTSVVAVETLYDQNFPWSSFSPAPIDDGSHNDTSGSSGSGSSGSGSSGSGSDGGDFKSSNVTVTLHNNAVFFVSVWIVTTPTMVANQTVPKRSIKFLFSVDSWPFQKMTNKLRVNSGLETKNEKEDCGSEDDSSKAVVTYGASFLDNPKIAYYDGVEGTVEIVTNLNGGSHPNVSWEFDSFNHTLKYDPVFGYQAPNAAAKLLPSFFLFAILACLAIF